MNTPGVSTKVTYTIKRARAARIMAFAGRVPPTEMKLWDAGANSTDYGTHWWTDRSELEVMGVYLARGNPLLIDVEHQGAVPKDGSPVPPVTAGYATLSLRNGEPWLSFEWSDFGAQQIATGQRRFLSPEYDVDKETGEILRLHRVSIVADAGTHRARVLASAQPKENLMDTSTVLAALRAALTAEDPEVAKQSIHALVSELSKGEAGGDDGGGPPVVGTPSAGAKDGMQPEGEPNKEMAAVSEDPKAVGEHELKPYAQAANEPERKEPTGGEPAKSVEEPLPSVAAGARPPPPKVPRLPARTIISTPGTGKTGVTAVHASAAPVDEEARRAIQASNDRMDAFQRDQLLKEQGHKLQEPIRIWASSQPLSIVEGLLKSAPDALAPPTQIQATRGGKDPGVRRHLTGAAREEFDKQFRKPKTNVIGPVVGRDGVLRIHAGCPGEWRRQQAEAGRPVASSKNVKA